MFQIGILTRTSDNEVMCTCHHVVCQYISGRMLLTKSCKSQLCLIVFPDYHSSKCGTSVFPFHQWIHVSFLSSSILIVTSKLQPAFVIASLNDLSWKFDKVQLELGSKLAYCVRLRAFGPPSRQAGKTGLLRVSNLFASCFQPSSEQTQVRFGLSHRFAQLSFEIL